MTETILSILVRGAALSVVVALGVLALRRAPAAHRHLAWTLGCAALLLLPAAGLALPEMRWALLPRPDVARGAAPVAAHTAIRDAVSAETTASLPDLTDTRGVVPAPAASAPAPASPAGLPSAIVAVWIAGMLLVGARLAAGVRSVRRLVRDAQDVADQRTLAIAGDAARRLGLARTPRLRISPAVETPLTTGVLRPCVLLPLEAPAWSDERLRFALLHEFAHVGRRDILAETVARAAALLHWPNPLAWFAIHRLRIERERACDDAVLCCGEPPQEYAGFLVSFARSVRRGPHDAAFAATMAAPAQLERRVRAILEAGPPRRAPSRRAAALLAAAATLPLVFAATVRPTQAADDDAPKKPPTATLTVSLDGTGDHTSVAAAIAAAPSGALVRVGPGTFPGEVAIDKPLTLEGAGADRTTIVSTGRREQGGAAPALRVTGVRGVVVRGLTLLGGDKPVESGVGTGAVVDVKDAGIRFEKTAVVSGAGSGVLIGDGCDVDVDGCLVAAVGGMGIFVSKAGERPSTVRIANSDLRNCMYCGIRVAAGNRAVTIEGCRISGSSWHGIRYDDAAPVVRGNLIFGNVRSGIYASGATEGRIEANLFHENGMSDVSCWYVARDVIERNSFVRSQRESVAILGASSPAVRRNVFFECKMALLAGKHNGTDAAPDIARLAIEENVFWRCEVIFRGSNLADSPDLALPAGNLIADPGFAGPERRDYSLPASSAAGVVRPLSFASPWPERPEEKATAPRPVPAPPAAAAPVVAVKPAEGRAGTIAGIKSDILQITDPALRERGLAELGESIRSPDAKTARAALMSLYEIRDAKYDKRRFRADVLARLADADPDVRHAAAYALVQVERDPGDADRVMALAEAAPVPPGVLLHVAMMLQKNRVEDRLAKLFVKALAVDDPVRGATDTANYLRGIWVAPEVEDAVVAAWRRHPTDRDGNGLWPYILGQLQPAPREARVRAIFELIAKGDDSARQLAGRAIERPVDEPARAVAAQLAAAGLADAPTAALRRTYLESLRANGGAEQVPALRAFAANEMVADDLRALAGKVADELAQRR